VIDGNCDVEVGIIRSLRMYMPNKILKTVRVRISENQQNVVKKNDTFDCIVCYKTMVLSHMESKMISQHKTHCFREA
jgi:hypothetical protein